MKKECLTCKTNETAKWYSGPLCRQCYRKLPHVKKSELATSKVCSKNYREKNKIHLAKRHKEWKENNIKHCLQYQKDYRQINRDTKNTLEKERRKVDIEFKLSCNLRRRLNIAIKKYTKCGSAVNDLGCSVKELKKYLESKWELGMSWENHTRTGWHIDHIKPLSSFNLKDPSQLKEACHYTNLQPLWAEDNLRKGDRYE